MALAGGPGVPGPIQKFPSPLKTFIFWPGLTLKFVYFSWFACFSSQKKNFRATSVNNFSVRFQRSLLFCAIKLITSSSAYLAKQQHLL